MARKARKGDDAAEAVKADAYNRRNALIERRANLTGGGGVKVAHGPGGISVSLPPPSGFWARLSGSANPYAFTRVRIDPATGLWAAIDGGASESGVYAYEVKDVAGLGTKVYWLEHGLQDEYLFEDVACCPGGDPYHVNNGCCPSATPTPTILSLTVNYPWGVGPAPLYVYGDATLTYYPFPTAPIPVCGGITSSVPAAWWSAELPNLATGVNAQGGTYRYFLVCTPGSFTVYVYEFNDNPDPSANRCWYPPSSSLNPSESYTINVPPTGNDHSTCDPFLLDRDPPSTQPHLPGFPGIPIYPGYFTISG